MTRFIIISITALSLLLIFLMTDCVCGTTKYYECYVTGREYKPPWTEIRTDIDTEGRTSINTIHHPEEYHLFCVETGGAESFDCLTTATLYHSITNEQDVTVNTRKGKWTGKLWVPTVEL
jgi:hypothetical protein